MVFSVRHVRERLEDRTFSAKNAANHLKLYTDSGEEMTLNRGKTYLALVDDDEWSSFNYQ